MKHRIGFLVIALVSISCTSEDTDSPPRIQVVTPVDFVPDPGVTIANIDFTNWKVTLPIDIDNNGSPDEIMPGGLINNRYRTNPALEGLMYPDDTDGSIVFHTFYGGAVTANTSFPHTELRELINPSNSRVNWTLDTGGTMKVRMKVEAVSNNTGTGSLQKDRFIVAQIHGIINPTDVARLNLSSDSAPPLLKMQWRDGNMVAYKKTLRNDNTSGNALYDRSNAIWGDISFNFGQVGYEPFDIEIKASTGKLEVIVNGQGHIFRDVSLQKWPFDNYFKAGNYIQTVDPAGFSTVKMYSLEVTH